VIGYVGAALIVLSYFLPTKWMLFAQEAGAAVLFAYAITIHSLPFVILEAACVFAVALRRARK